MEDSSDESSHIDAPTHPYNLRDRKVLAAQTKTRQAQLLETAIKEAEVKEARARTRSKKTKEVSSPKSASTSSKRKKSKHDSDNDSDPDWFPSYERESSNRPTYKPTNKPIRYLPLASPCSSDDDLEADFTSQIRTPQHSFHDLKGMDDLIKQLLAELVSPFAHPRKAGLLELEVPRGVLFTGLPGTGKTALADSIVSAIRAEGREVKYFQETGRCLSKYVGESEKHLRSIFKNARDSAPSVIFLDELDGLGRKRSANNNSAAMNTILTTLLTEMNNIPRGHVLVLAATNCPQICDPALVRQGRFDLKFNVGLPNSQAREEILKFYLTKKRIAFSAVQLEEVVNNTISFSGSDLESLVKQTYNGLVSRHFPSRCWRDMADKEIEEEKKKMLKKVDLDLDVWPKLKQFLEAKRQNIGSENEQ